MLSEARVAAWATLGAVETKACATGWHMESMARAIGPWTPDGTWTPQQERGTLSSLSHLSPHPPTSKA
jgi:hypothetical protein